MSIVELPTTLVSISRRFDGQWHAGIYADHESIDLGDHPSALKAQAVAEDWICANATAVPGQGWRVTQLDKWVHAGLVT